ncbi:MAG TPA: hypothetical protein VHC95_07035 [Opitutales bacterium]|nr:hypothetical protein [Opitutales bacterium]
MSAPSGKRFSPDEMKALETAMDILMSRFDLAIIHILSPGGAAASFMPIKRELPLEVIRDLNDKGRNCIQQTLNLPRGAISTGTATAAAEESTKH